MQQEKNDMQEKINNEAVSDASDKEKEAPGAVPMIPVTDPVAPGEIPQNPAEPGAEVPTPEEEVTVHDSPAVPVGDPTAVPEQGNTPIRRAGGEVVPDYTYRWTYGEQISHDKKSQKKRRRSGALTYAVVMSVAFLLTFGTLMAVILTGGVLTGNDVVSGGDSSTPTVVTQVIERTIYVKETEDKDGYLSIPEIAAKIGPSVVGISVLKEDATGTGTGVIMTADGYIATNAHVVEGGLTFTVVLPDGTEYDARVIGADEWSDLAVIKIDAKDLPAATFGNSDELIVGESVVAIGTPSSLDYAGTVTDGIVSAINRRVKIYNDDGTLLKKMSLIQTNVAINPGNSGGALINRRGEVIGITSMKLSNGYVGVGFAIPSTGAMEILQDIIKNNGYTGNGSSSIVTKRPLLGIRGGGCRVGQTVEMDDGSTVVANMDGVIVVGVTDGLDAKNKLVPGDIIVKVNGKTVTDIYAVMDIVNNRNPGESITVEYYRDGVYGTADIVLGSE